MADRKGLGFIGWAFGAVTAAVIAISSFVVTAGVPQSANAETAITFSAATR